MNCNKKYIVYQLFIIVLLFLFSSNINAQQKKESGLSKEVMAWTISTLEYWPPGRYASLNDAIIDNNFFVTKVFRGGLFPKIDYHFSIDSVQLTEEPIPDPYAYQSRHVKNMFRHYFFNKRLNDMVYREVLLKDPANFEFAMDQLPGKTIISKSIDNPNTNIVTLDIKSPTIKPKDVDPIVKFIPDRKYWISSFAADIKFSQNRTSTNWYKGEINNINIFTNTITSYNYSKDKLSLSNTLTTTFTINNAPSDTLRKYTIGSDELRFRSNFGLKAVGNWNYSSSAEFITSMGNKYITNTETKNSAFLAPFTVNVGVGMTFNPKPKFKNKDRSLNLSLSLEPFSFKYMYSRDRNINLGAYFPKNEEGNYDYILRTFGSTITMTKTTKFNKNVSWYSRLYYFTNYERAIGEFENKLDIALSRYFSTTLYLYLRYDDGVTKKEETDSYLQMNEMFSFGFSYKW
jgi:NAD-specific glutamate dehydrogenase